MRNLTTSDIASVTGAGTPASAAAFAGIAIGTFPLPALASNGPSGVVFTSPGPFTVIGAAPTVASPSNPSGGIEDRHGGS